jgi:hypothetical protein
MLSFIIIIVAVLGVIILSVVMLIVVAPQKRGRSFCALRRYDPTKNFYLKWILSTLRRRQGNEGDREHLGKNGFFKCFGRVLRFNFRGEVYQNQ